NNTATNYGDAYLNGTDSVNLIDNCTFENNTATYETSTALTVVSGNGQITITATVTNKDTDELLSGEKVYFYVNGKEVGSATTDKNGEARFTYSVPKTANYSIYAKTQQTTITNDTGNYTFKESTSVTKTLNVNKPLTPAKIKVYSKKTTSKKTKKHKIYYITYSIKNYGEKTGSKTFTKSLKKILKKHKIYKIQTTKNTKYNYNKAS
ncbi:hypothetical protein, partial [Methanobrevibacter cuticularis]|uniref:hypothetical protein n=1 Tax=Methanobrevibacter cuticularis TaxID=47311 RepID=UPI001470C69B